MRLAHLKASRFRNITELDSSFGPRFNLIHGANGSGKSTLLEIIYCLGRGRSFRTALSQPIIQHHADACTVFGRIESPSFSTRIGLEKSRQRKTRLKIGQDQQLPAFSELARLLPLQLIHPGSYDFLHGGPKPRRQFLDWGVFHVEPQFFPLWQRYTRILKQRNAALQQHQDLAAVRAWHREMSTLGEALLTLRQQYLSQLTDILSSLLPRLLAHTAVSLGYYRGWEESQDLASTLDRHIERDAALGYTTCGPHRADLRIRVQDIPAVDVLSRGEQKRLLCALYLAQGQVLYQLTGQHCVYLLDDIMAELDADAQAVMWEVLAQLEAQVFVTAINPATFATVPLSEADKRFCIHTGRLTCS